MIDDLAHILGSACVVYDPLGLFPVLGDAEHEHGPVHDLDLAVGSNAGTNR